jgi:hypothetical protein
MWKAGESLKSSSDVIAKDCLSFYRKESDNTLHHKVIDKYKNDIIDKLCREANEPTQYIGLDNFIKMSAGIPRHLLIILKHVFRWANFNGEKPFISNQPIKMDSQNSGLAEAAHWFLEDARIPGTTGELVQSSLERLGYLLKEIRQSQTPPECSICTFRLNPLELDRQIHRILEYLTNYSYLINVSERRDKNTNRQDVTYQINGLLSPHFELAIARRGVISISKVEAEIIFLAKVSGQFDDLIKSRKAKYNPPFEQTNSSLFQ